MKDKLGVGIVGTGRRGLDLAECLARLSGSIDLEIRGLCNRTHARAESARDQIREAYLAYGRRPDITVYDDHRLLVDDPRIDVVMVCTPQYAHRDPALYAIERRKKLYVDKPLAHNLADAIEIYRAQQRAGSPIIMSFTRRFEQPWIDTFELVSGEKVIGKPRMMLVRDVIPYDTYFHTWHRRMEWSGGVVGDKMSHMFDALNWFAGDAPDRLSAFGGQAVFAPDRDAPERCSRCDRDCPYRAAEQRGLSGTAGRGASDPQRRPDEMVDRDESRLDEAALIKRHDTCVWHPGADINDHGVINIEYRRGLKATLFFSVFGPDSDDQETFEIVGDSGRIILTRHTATIDIVSDHGKNRRSLDMRTAETARSHFGADDNFVLELDRFAKGAPPKVGAEEGLLSSRMVEATHRSIRAGGGLIHMVDIEDG